MSTAPDEKKEAVEVEGELSYTDTEWRFFKVVGRVLAAILTLTACYIHALTIKHAVTPKFWHGFHPKQT